MVLQTTSRLKSDVMGFDSGTSKLFEKSLVSETGSFLRQDAPEFEGKGRAFNAGRFTVLVKSGRPKVRGKGLGITILVLGCSGLLPKLKRRKENDVTSEIGLRSFGVEASLFEVSAGVRMLTTYSRRGDTALTFFLSPSSCSETS